MQLTYVTLSVDDPGPVRDWYVQTLGLRPAWASEAVVLLAGDGGGRLGLHRGTPLDRPERVQLHFAVPDVDAVYARLRDRGVPFEQPPKDTPWGYRVAVLRDPAGHTVEIYSPQPRGARPEAAAAERAAGEPPLDPEIRPLARLDARDFKRIVTGYRSPARYRVVREDGPDRAAFRLELEPLAEPYVKRFGPYDRSTLQRYRRLLRHGASLGAYAGGTLVALAVAEPHRWNSSLWVWEFHVADDYRGRGVGTRLMEALADRAAAMGLRVVICETQNTNVPAIQFYRKRGFVLDGVDVSYYKPEAGEVAVFMKRHLDGGGAGRREGAEPAVTVRGYRPEDLEACRALWAELTAHHRRLYDDPAIGGPDPGRHFDAHLARVGPERIWVAEVGGRVAGFAGLLPREVEPELEPLVVHPAHRGRGVGRALVQAVAAAARAAGARRVMVRPVARNADAIRFFHAAGFDALGQVELLLDLDLGGGLRWRAGERLAGCDFQV